MEQNKMGIMPINKLIINMSLPMIVSMLVQALYNVVDSIFVAQISEDALTAVSLSFPVQNLLIALCIGTSVGVNSLISRSLGEKKFEFASLVAENGIFLSLLSYLFVAILGIFFVKPFFTFQTDSQEIINYGISYLSIVVFFSFGIFFEAMYEKIIQSTGKTLLTMITQCIGAVVNLIFDPIMIFGLFGFPKLGIKGAALATVLGQIVAMFTAMIFQRRYNKEVRMNIKQFHPDKQVIKKIYEVGLPSIVMQSISSFMVFGVNKILLSFTSTATAVFGVYFKLQSLVFMPVFGLNTGIIPIIGYNFGAKDKERMLKTVKYSVFYGVSIMTVGFLIIQFMPILLLKAFNAQQNMIGIGVPALRILSFVFIPAGLCIVLGSTFQAVGKGMPSMVISFSRQLVILLPVAYLLSLTNNLNLVWLSFPIAEVFSVLLTLYYFKKIKREVIDFM